LVVGEREASSPPGILDVGVSAPVDTVPESLSEYDCEYSLDGATDGVVVPLGLGGIA